MANKQQTAVEWLIKELTIFGYFKNGKPAPMLEKALEMEREQMIQFAYEQIRHMESELGDMIYHKVPEELYNQIFSLPDEQPE